MKTDKGPCKVCGSESETKCSGCQSVHYCSKDHQRKDWKNHKWACTPAKVKDNEVVGRYLEATRDIKVGEIVMREKPLITGPAQITPPVCLGCYKELKADNHVTCEKCGWPFCSEGCTKKEEHQPECYYTQQRGDKLWQKLQAHQSHCAERNGTDKWQHDKKMVADFLHQFFKLSEIFSEDEIMRCCGILQVNGHEIPLTEPEYVSLFERISMVEHSCRANCNKSFADNGDLLLCAGVPIAAGSHLTVCYTDPMWGTETRRHHLADSWFFECSCSRCSDVTEFGTMYSCVKCKKKDCKGYLLPETFIIPILHKTTNPDPETRNLDDKFWTCNSCKDQVSDAIIQQLLQDIGKEISIMPKEDIEACERFIAHCSSYLHPNHYYITDVSQALAHLIGQESELGLAGVSDDRLQLKLQLCRKIADLIETVAPAETRSRGSLLFELHAAVAEAGRRRSLTEGPGVMAGHVAESRRILSESARLLQHEPECLPEGKLRLQAAINLRELDGLLTRLSNALPSPM